MTPTINVVVLITLVHTCFMLHIPFQIIDSPSVQECNLGSSYNGNSFKALLIVSLTCSCNGETVAITGSSHNGPKANPVS